MNNAQFTIVKNSGKLNFCAVYVSIDKAVQRTEYFFGIGFRYFFCYKRRRLAAAKQITCDFTVFTDNEKCFIRITVPNADEIACACKYCDKFGIGSYRTVLNIVTAVKPTYELLSFWSFGIFGEIRKR